jgi:hypothetical protein
MTVARGAATWLLAVGLVATVRAAAPVLSVHDDRVTARLDDVPLPDVVHALAASTGCEVRGTPDADRRITTDLADVPLVDAMPRLLGGRNFTLRYRTDGRLAALVLLGAPAPPAAVAAASPAAGSAAPSPAGPKGFPLVLSRVVTRHRPVALPDRLAAAMGGPTATFPQLLDRAMRDDDGVNRTEASMVVLGALEKESALRRSFLRSLLHLDEAERAALMAGEDGERFREILAIVAAHSREPSLQKKAATVLGELAPAAGS